MLATVLGLLSGLAVLAVAVASAGVLGLPPIAGDVALPGSWLAGPPAAQPSTGSGADTFTAAPLTGPPLWVRIPSIGVSAPLERLGLDSTGALEPPGNFDDAGWYAGGTAPGDIGPAVIAGHIDTTVKGAVFYRLRDLKSGAKVEIDRGGRWLTFTVYASGQYSKTDFPTAAVYDATPTAQLRLITCGGSFDKAHRTYLDNVVVYAVESS